MKSEKYAVNEKGYVFVVALLLIVLISVLGLSLMTITSNTFKTTQHERTDQSVYYIAEAGLNEKRVEISQKLNNLLNEIIDEKDNKTLEFEERIEIIIGAYEDKLDSISLEEEKSFYKNYARINNEAEEPEVYISIKMDGDNAYIIESTGVIDNISRTVSQRFELAIPNLVPDDSSGDAEEDLPNFCYGILAESITTGNDYNSSNSNSPDIVSLKDDIIVKTGQFTNIYTPKSITFDSTHHIRGNVIAGGNIQVNTNGYFYKNIISGNNITFNNTTQGVQGDIIAIGNIEFKSGGTYNKDVVAGNNILANSGGRLTIRGNTLSNGNITLNTASSISGFLYSDNKFSNNQTANISGSVFSRNEITSVNWGDVRLGSARYSTRNISYNNNSDNKNNNPNISNEQFNSLRDTILSPNYSNYNNILSDLFQNKINSPEYQGANCNGQTYTNASLPSVPNFLTVDPSSYNQISDINLSGGTNGSIDITDSTYIHNITLTSNRTLTINLGNDETKTKTLVIDNLLASGNYNGHLYIQGEGKLNILVRDQLQLNNVKISNERNPYDTTIYFAGANKLLIGGSSEIQSNIFTKQADIELTGSGKIFGNIIMGEIKSLFLLVVLN